MSTVLDTCLCILTGTYLLSGVTNVMLWRYSHVIVWLSLCVGIQIIHTYWFLATYIIIYISKKEMKICCFMSPLSPVIHPAQYISCRTAKLWQARDGENEVSLKHYLEWVWTSDPVIKIPTRYFSCTRPLPLKHELDIHVHVGPPPIKRSIICLYIYHRYLCICTNVCERIIYVSYNEYYINICDV